MTGLFVTGTDTGIGKTLVAAICVRLLDAEYWKPLQTGLADEPGDTATITRLANPRAVHPPTYALPAALSPEAAAAQAGVTIDPARLVLPSTPHPLVVEGAGGVLVPITPTLLMADLIRTLGLPALIVARSTLGTVNHTLLTLAALRARAIPILGVVLNGPPNPANRAAIEHHGDVAVLAELPPLTSIGPAEISDVAGKWSKARALPLTRQGPQVPGP